MPKNIKSPGQLIFSLATVIERTLYDYWILSQDFKSQQLYKKLSNLRYFVTFCDIFYYIFFLQVLQCQIFLWLFLWCWVLGFF